MNTISAKMITEMRVADTIFLFFFKKKRNIRKFEEDICF